MSLSVREFVLQMYRLITASNPVIPEHGDDQKLAIRVLNQILTSYASSGLMLTIAKTVSCPIDIGIKEVLFTNRNYPTETTQTELVTLVNGSPSFNVVNGGLYSVDDEVTGNGIPANTIINDISGNVIALNNASTLSGQSTLTFVHDTTDPSIVYIKEGRLANLDSAWLLLSGVTYPLIDKSRDEFLAAWKYEPLEGLPRFIITYPQTDLVRAQIYPAPSQSFEFNCRGKFQLTSLTANDTLQGLPDYFELYLLYACAKYVSKFKGRGSAWTPDLEADYRELKDNMESASEVNLSIAGDEQSLLNGAYRVKAGI